MDEGGGWLKLLRMWFKGRQGVLLQLTLMKPTLLTTNCGWAMPMVKDWERVPFLISLKRVVIGGTSNSLTSVILKACATEGTLDGQALAKKLVCFGADGVNIFEGCCTGATTQLKENYVPFMVGIHCCAHQVNLSVCYYVRLPHSCQVWGASPICAAVLLHVKCFFFIASHIASLQKKLSILFTIPVSSSFGSSLLILTGLFYKHASRSLQHIFTSVLFAFKPVSLIKRERFLLWV